MRQAQKPERFTPVLRSGCGKTQLVEIVRILARQAARGDHSAPSILGAGGEHGGEEAHGRG